MKTCPYFKQTADPAVETYPSSSWFDNARKDFQQRRFASAVATNNADNFARFDLQIYIFQCPDCLYAILSLLLIFPEWRRNSTNNGIPQGAISSIACAEAIFLAYLFYCNDRAHIRCN